MHYKYGNIHTGSGKIYPQGAVLAHQISEKVREHTMTDYEAIARSAPYIGFFEDPTQLPTWVRAHTVAIATEDTYAKKGIKLTPERLKLGECMYDRRGRSHIQKIRTEESPTIDKYHITRDLLDGTEGLTIGYQNPYILETPESVEQSMTKAPIPEVNPLIRKES